MFRAFTTPTISIIALRDHPEDPQSGPLVCGNSGFHHSEALKEPGLRSVGELWIVR